MLESRSHLSRPRHSVTTLVSRASPMAVATQRISYRSCCGDIMHNTNRATLELKLIIGLIVDLSRCRCCGVSSVRAKPRYAGLDGCPVRAAHQACRVEISQVGHAPVASGMDGRAAEPDLRAGLADCCRFERVRRALDGLHAVCRRRSQRRQECRDAGQPRHGAGAHQRPARRLPQAVTASSKDCGAGAWVGDLGKRAFRATVFVAGDETSREACRKVMDLRKELAAATDFERLVREARCSARSWPASTSSPPTTPCPRPSRDHRTARRAGWQERHRPHGQLILGLVSAFGPFGLDTLRGQRPRLPALGPPAQPATMSRAEARTRGLPTFSSSPRWARAGRARPAGARCDGCS